MRKSPAANTPAAATSGRETNMNSYERAPNGWSRWKEVVTGGFLAVVAFLLFTEHRAHVLGILPYLVLLLCPLMHLFMHGGHGGHGARREDRGEKHEWARAGL